jgi:uncharacterized membrane protein YkoI
MVLFMKRSRFFRHSHLCILTAAAVLPCVSPAMAFLNEDQAQAIALAQTPGEVIRSEQDKEGGRPLHEISIRTRDDSVYEVKVDAETGQITGVEIESLGKDVPLPEPKLSIKEAEVIAVDHVKKNTQARGRASLQGSAHVLRYGRAIYEVEVKKLFTVYAVTVDAETGDVLSMNERQ